MRVRMLRRLSALLVSAPILTTTVLAQSPTGSESPPKPVSQAGSMADTVASSLMANPVTAPYPIRVDQKNGRIVLTGRVGTKEVHDTAVRIAMSATSAIDDRLVIDTGTVYRSLSRPATSAVANPQNAMNLGPPAYVYPPPLFGRIDEPFLGFDPPIISYPPWWRTVAARRGDPYGAPVLDPFSPIGPDPGPANPGARPAFPSPVTSAEPGRSVEMTIDPRGVALLRGTVPSEEIRLGIGQKAAKLPGVKDIINQIEVDPSVGEVGQPIGAQEQPPPPPTPAPPPPANPMPVGAVPRALPAEELADSPDRRLARAIERRPALEKLGVKTEVKEGVAYLSGKVPTVLEAMMAFRTAQQTVGVRDVVDRLEFAVPDGLKPNPLISSGRPEDVEPYLEAQIRRQVSDRAHIDRIRVTGDRLELRGSVSKESDRAGVEAILRSMPLLRGFTIDARMVAD